MGFLLDHYKVPSARAPRVDEALRLRRKTRFLTFTVSWLPIQIGDAFTILSWSPSGRSSFISTLFGGRTFIVPLAPGEALPRIPAGGFHSEEEIAPLPGVRPIDSSGVVPGPSPHVYAFYRYCIPIS